MKKYALLSSLIALAMSSAAMADGCTNFAGTYKVTAVTVTANGQTIPQNEVSADLIVIQQNACQSINLIDNSPTNPSNFQIIMDGQPHQQVQNGETFTSTGRFDGASALINLSSAQTATTPPVSIAMTLELNPNGTLSYNMVINNSVTIVSTATRQ